MNATTLPASHRYERWSGTLHSGRWTWLAIVAHGLRQGYKRSEMRLFLMSALGLVVGACVLFFQIALIEQLAGMGEIRESIGFLRHILGVNLEPVTQFSDLRGLLWRLTFLFGLKVEFVWVLFVAASVGPGLIADDLKTKALPIYFARPVRPWNYLVGKSLVVAIFVAAVTLLPNLLALFVGTLLTGGLATWGETLDLAARIVVSGVGIMVLAGTLLPALSSLSPDKRWVTFGWFALCMLPMAAQGILTNSLGAENTRGFLGSLALNRNVSILLEWLFDLRGSIAATKISPEVFERALGPSVQPMYPAIVLGSLVAVSVLICYRRVVRFSRTAANI